MPRRKGKKEKRIENIDVDKLKVSSPITAKIVLFVFGIGPLLLMSLFLFSKGFFSLR
tara:strand:- start:181 stop:351 length:171 start_codon:yes stop_codon:yes gene_type:complete